MILVRIINLQVSDYVNDRIIALRQKQPGQYSNIACIRKVVAESKLIISHHYTHKAVIRKLLFVEVFSKQNRTS